LKLSGRLNPPHDQRDRIACDAADNDNIAVVREFISRYPSSPLAIIARNRLELLERLAK
jgi:hypothetical protein